MIRSIAKPTVESKVLDEVACRTAVCPAAYEDLSLAAPTQFVSAEKNDEKITGILLINLGTPANPSVAAVRKYLAEFLNDPRVIELPAVLRWLLLKLVILPTRAKKSAAAYKSIWQPEGSPLMVNSQALTAKLQAVMGKNFAVALGMRYGQPSIEQALEKLYAANISRLIVLPLFPQYASAVNGSALAQTMQLLAKNKEILPCTFINDFHHEPAYISANIATIAPYLQNEHDFVLFSFHGLPERQLINPGISCYKTKCLQTADALAKNLKIASDKYMVSFQSRLGKLAWIKPYTEQTLHDLRQRNVQKLIVICPSFVADCLETLEEIGIRAKEQWQELGGSELQLVPCLNAHPAWVKSLREIILKYT